MTDKIKGYRELTRTEIDLINEIKGHAEVIGELVRKLESTTSTDLRWLAIGRTELQQGFMALNRSVAKPETF